jgi:glycosyltransferase involved in cell wall biosynthesis
MTKTLTLVVPCYNEAARIDRRAFIQAIEKWPWISFCFVDDGSTDSTSELLAHMANLSPAFHAIYLPENAGKAEAVRAGVMYLCENTRADFIGFWDADLATPLDEVQRFMSLFEDFPQTRVIMGSRCPFLGTNIRRTACRGLVGGIVRLIIRFALGVPVWDTQCGAKIFTRELAQELFKNPFRTQWLFDVEILSRLGKRLSTTVRECPLNAWFDVPGSKINLRALMELLFMPIAIRLHLV